MERRHEDEQHEQLAELDADVEREQRRQEVRAGELQRLPQREREAEAVHQAEGERDDPAALPEVRRSDDVLERHVDDRGGDRVSTSGGNHSASGARSKAEAISVIECATVNAVTTSTSGRKRRNGITRQSRNSRWSVPSRMWTNPSSTNRSAA